MPIQNLKIRNSDLCPNCGKPMPISHADMAKQNIDAINAGLLQHDCPWPCGESWYTRLSPEEKERALRERGMA